MRFKKARSGFILVTSLYRSIILLLIESEIGVLRLPKLQSRFI